MCDRQTDRKTLRRTNRYSKTDRFTEREKNRERERGRESESKQKCEVRMSKQLGMLINQSHKKPTLFLTHILCTLIKRT